MVDFIQHALPFHVAQELDTLEGEEEDRKQKVLRAFLMADIHARQVGILSSGAAVALCLIQVCNTAQKGVNPLYVLALFLTLCLSHRELPYCLLAFV